MGHLVIRQKELGPMENFVYVVGDRDSGEALVVDPAWDVPAILAMAEEMGLTIVGAMLTHTHHDHCNGVGQLVEATDCRVYVHSEERGRLPDLKENIVRTEGGHRIRVGDMDVQFLHTPGHTAGSQCFYIQDKLVSGDTLFIDHCGRCDFPESDPEKMWSSLHDVLGKLPGGTTLLPGHNYADRAPITESTLEDERQHNKYLLCGDKEEFLRVRMGL